MVVFQSTGGHPSSKLAERKRKSQVSRLPHMSLTRFPLLTGILWGLSFFAPLFGQEVPLPKNSSALPAPFTVVSEVVVPSPPEIFSVLDKLGTPDWAGQIRLQVLPTNTDRTKLALAFGGIVAEGFLAVQAKKTEAIQEVGRRALKIARALGLEDAVTPHANGIMEAAEKADWKAVRAELDLTEQTVKEQLAILKDQELGGLVSLGGWLRGTHAVTALISADYNQDHAEILHQPELVKHFQNHVAAMTRTGQEKPELDGLQDGLSQLLSLMQTASDNEGFTAAEVSEVHGACEKVLQEFYLPHEPKSAP